MGMSVELPSPGKIVGYADLETLARRKAPAITQEFEADMRSHGGVIGSEFVPNKDCRIYIGWMTQTVFPIAIADLRPRESKQFIYDAFKIGALLADRLLGPEQFRPDTSNIKSNLVSSQDFYTRMLTLPAAYLNQRETLGNLLWSAAPSLSELPLAQERAVLLGGLTLMSIDQSRYKEFATGQADFREAVEILDRNRTGET
jgi:hypothetical protein